jgi:hypothetical protein
VELILRKIIKGINTINEHFKNIDGKNVDLLKIEAKLILKKSSGKILESTILDILASSFGYGHYKKYFDSLSENYCENIPRKLSDHSIAMLDDLEKDIVDCLNKAKEYNINSIKLIQDEKALKIDRIKTVQALDLAKLFTLVPYALKGFNKIIDVNWALHKYGLKAFIYWYADEISKLSDTSKTYLEDYEEYLSKKELLSSLNRSYSNYKRNGSILDRGLAIVQKDFSGDELGEGFFFDLIYQLVKQKISIDVVIDKINKRITEEKYFREISFKSEYNKEILIESVLLKDRENIFSDSINELTSGLGYSEILLGYESKMHDYSIVKKIKKDKHSKKICLNKSEYHENIMITGSCGSGRESLNHDLFFQDIKGGKGVIYFNTYGDSSVVAKLNTILVGCERTEDLIYLNYNTAKSYLSNSENVKNLINRKKVVLIMLPAMEKCSVEIWDNFADILEYISIGIQEVYGLEEDSSRCYGMSTAIYTHELFCLNERALGVLDDLMKETKNKQVKFVLNSYDFYSKNKEDFNKIINENIGIFLIMKSEDPRCLQDYFQLNGLSIRDFKNMHPGFFRIVRNKIIDPQIYKAVYIEQYFKSYPEIIINSLKIEL